MDPKRVGKFVGIGILVLLVLVALLFAVGVLGVPDGGLEGNEWGDVDDQRIEVITTIWVDNPNPIGLGGDVDVEYEIDLEGVRMAEGAGTDIGISSGSNTLTFNTDLLHNNLPQWWSRHLNNGEVSHLEANATVHASLGPVSGSPSTTIEDEIDTDIEGALDESVSEFEGEYPAAAPLFVIEDVTAEWGEVTEAQTEVLVTATIHNPELPDPTPVPTPAFQGAVTFNDIPMAEWSAGDVEVLDGDEDAMIPAGETEERTFRIVMDNQRVPPWFASHVENDEYTEMVVTAQLVFDFDGDEFVVPPEGGIQCTFDLRTDIFVDQDAGSDLQHCGVAPPEVFGDDGILDLVENGLLDGNGDNGLLDGNDDNGLLDGNDDDGLLDGNDDEENGLLNGTDEEDEDDGDGGLLDGNDDDEDDENDDEEDDGESDAEDDDGDGILDSR